MDESFTPGPWEHDVERNDISWLSFSDGSGIPLGTTKANADLIAAAPELYGALRNLLTINELLDGEGVLAKDKAAALDRANAALAKARGEAASPPRNSKHLRTQHGHARGRHA